MRKATDTGEIELYVDRQGEGPEVLLIAGLGDPAEAWQFQLDGLSDRYRLTASPASRGQRAPGENPMRDNHGYVDSQAESSKPRPQRTAGAQAAAFGAWDAGEALSALDARPFGSCRLRACVSAALDVGTCALDAAHRLARLA